MENTTTTTNDTTSAGAEQALPVAGTQDVAVTQTTEANASEKQKAEQAVETTDAEAPKQSQDTGDQASLPDEEKLKSFAKGQGIEDISELTPREQSLLKSAYDNKAAADRNYQRTSALEKDLTTKSDEYAEEVALQTGQDPEVLKRLQRMEVKDAVRDFWSTPDESGNVPDKSLEPSMIEILQQRPYLKADLEALYAFAAVKSGNLSSVKSQGKREALESLAHKQQAAVPTGNATNPGFTPKAKPFEELSISEMEAKLGFARR